MHKKACHAESNLASVETRESCLLFLFNGQESYSLRNAVQQEHNKYEHHLVVLLCLSDSFEVMEAHSIKALFWNSVLNCFHFRKNKVHLIPFVKRRIKPLPSESCAELHVVVVDALHPISDSSVCSPFPTRIAITRKSNSFQELRISS